MPMSVHADIVSWNKSIYSGLVQILVAPGTEGELGIQYGHAPLLTKLEPGVIRLVEQNGDEKIFYTNGGILEVQSTLISVLSDEVARVEDLDEESAKKAMQSVKDEMAQASGDGSMNHAALAARLAEMTAQLRAIERARRLSKR